MSAKRRIKLPGRFADNDHWYIVKFFDDGELSHPVTACQLEDKEENCGDEREPQLHESWHAPWDDGLLWEGEVVSINESKQAAQKYRTEHYKNLKKAKKTSNSKRKDSSPASAAAKKKKESNQQKKETQSFRETLANEHANNIFLACMNVSPSSSNQNLTENHNVPNLPTSYCTSFQAPLSLTPSLPSASVALHPTLPSTPSASVALHPTLPSTPSASVALHPTLPSTPSASVALHQTLPSTPSASVALHPTLPSTPSASVALHPTLPSTPSASVALHPTLPSTPSASVALHPTLPSTPSASVALHPTLPSTPSASVALHPTLPSTPSASVALHPTLPSSPSASVALHPTLPSTPSASVALHPTLPSSPSASVALHPTLPSTPSASVALHPTLPSTQSASVALYPTLPHTLSPSVAHYSTLPSTSTNHVPLSALNSASSTNHVPLSAQNSASSTNHVPLSALNSASSTNHVPLSAQNSASSTNHSSIDQHLHTNLSDSAVPTVQVYASTPGVSNNFLSMLDSNCGECASKDSKILSLEAFTHKLSSDVEYWRSEYHKLKIEKENVCPIVTPDASKVSIVDKDHYRPRRGIQIDRCEYVFLGDDQCVPTGYTYLVPGSSLVVPVAWLEAVKAQFKGKTKPHAAKLILSGFFQPSEMLKKTGSEILSTPVGKALQMYFIQVLSMEPSAITRAINTKIHTMTRAIIMKRTENQST